MSCWILWRSSGISSSKTFCCDGLRYCVDVADSIARFLCAVVASVGIYLRFVSPESERQAVEVARVAQIGAFGF